MGFMLLLLAVSGYVVLAKSSLDELPVHPGVGGLYKGPNSETIIKGPDGSIITAEAEGGSIVVQPVIEPILVEESTKLQSITPVAEVGIAPDVSLGTGVVAAELPIVASAIEAAPNVVHTVEVIQPDPHLIETEIVDAPPVEPQQATDLVGPSGSISTRGSSSVVSGPASTTISEPAKVIVATPIVAAVPVIASVKTPLRAVPVVEVVPDTPPPITSFILQPTVTTASTVHGANISPEISGSTLLPLTSLGNAPTVNSVTEITGQILSSTAAAAPRSWELLSTPAPGLLSSTVASDLVDPRQHLGPLGVTTSVRQPAATIESASSFGVIENAGSTDQIPSTLRPELSVVSTTLPEPNQSLQNSLNYALVNSRQLSINPSLIPSANIIPPEIRPFSKDTIDLSATGIFSSTPRPLPTVDSSNIQTSVSAALRDNSVNFDSRAIQLQEVPIQNQEIGNSKPPINAVNRNPAIHPGGLLGSGLAEYGIHSTQINLAQVPLSSARRLSPNSPLPTSLDREIDDVSSTLWNRYGRDADKEDKSHNKEKN